MSGHLDFAAATGNGEGAAMFVAHWLAPLFSGPFAIDSRKVDGLWVHLPHDTTEDTNAARARQAAAWQRAIDAEEWPA